MATAAPLEMVSGHEALPRNVAPTRYNIRLSPDLNLFTYDGDEEVELTIAQPTRTVTFNSLGLAIPSASALVSGRHVNSTGIAFDEAKGTCTVAFGEELPAGTTTRLLLAFSGSLSDNLAGFYRSRMSNGRYVAVTQFEPCDARRAFPCWDEPSAKARFRITLVVDEGLTALSNMPEESRTVVGGRAEVRFAETPVMSTYLVALAVGEFDHVEGRTKEGVLVRIYTQPGVKSQGEFSLRVATWVLSYFGEYFAIPFPLPKCDFLAVSDFSFGAMENWGLITFRETALLIDEKKSSVAARQRVANVVAHEIAHQWFGNLVTMTWWNDLWLNEGFATYIAAVAVDKIHPEWDTWTDFVYADLLRALSLDSLDSTHPIEVPIKSALEVNEIFDAISYSKGASVIRMLASYIGEEAFQKGLRAYLHRFSYKNTVTEDLWQALKEASGVDVKALMSCWTSTPGYPVISISQVSPTELKITQQRFFASGSSSEGKDQLWWVPLGLRSDSEDLNKNVLFSTATHTLSHKAAPGFWLKANAGQTGMYRVKYDDDLLARMHSLIESKQLSASDRLGIQGDAFSLAQSGMLRTSQALELSLVYQHEDDCNVWTDLAGNYSGVLSLWKSEPTYNSLLSLVRKLFTPISKSLGFDKKEGEADLVSKLRGTILRQLLMAGDLDIRRETLSRWENARSNPSCLQSDERELVFSAAARFGGSESLAHLKAAFAKCELQEQKVSVLSSVGFTDDAETALQALEWALKSKEVRSQDYFFVVASVSANWPVVAWNYLKDNWALLSDVYSGALLPRIVQLSTARLHTEEQLQDVVSFFATRTTPGLDMTVRQSLEKIRVRRDWLARDRSDVAALLHRLGFADA
eukprot:m51a1_g3383 putative puromycin-sensitive aminopeptidase-like (864) ;mRNA; f:495047-498699